MDIQIVKKKEVWIWLVILIAASAFFFLFRKFQQPGSEVVVEVGSEETMRLPLDENQTVKIEGKDGFYVQISIQDGTVKVTEAACPDQICVSHGPVSGTMDSIVCLPAQVVISVEQQEEHMESIDGVVR